MHNYGGQKCNGVVSSGYIKQSNGAVARAFLCVCFSNGEN